MTTRFFWLHYNFSYDLHPIKGCLGNPKRWLYLRLRRSEFFSKKWVLHFVVFSQQISVQFMLRSSEPYIWTPTA